MKKLPPKTQVDYNLKKNYDLLKMVVVPGGRFASIPVQIKSARFEGNNLYILLSDGREISLPIDQMDWLKWLANATPEQRANGQLNQKVLRFIGKS